MCAFIIGIDKDWTKHGGVTSDILVYTDVPLERVTSSAVKYMIGLQIETYYIYQWVANSVAPKLLPKVVSPRSALGHPPITKISASSTEIINK